MTFELDRIKQMLLKFVTCNHPDHTENETCADRTISCSAECMCCNEPKINPLYEAECASDALRPDDKQRLNMQAYKDFQAELNQQWNGHDKD